jgi:GR25 family glycosyltransferase involved in LPS biosynthesis
MEAAQQLASDLSRGLELFNNGTGKQEAVNIFLNSLEKGWSVVDANFADDGVRELFERERYRIFIQSNTSPISQLLARNLIVVGGSEDDGKIYMEMCKNSMFSRMEFTSPSFGVRLSCLCALKGISQKLGMKPVLDASLWKKFETTSPFEKGYLSRVLSTQFSGVENFRLNHLNFLTTSNVVAEKKTRFSTIKRDENVLLNIILKGDGYLSPLYFPDGKIFPEMLRYLFSNEELLFIREKHGIKSNTAFRFSDSDEEDVAFITSSFDTDTDIKVVPEELSSIEKIAFMASCPRGGVCQDDADGWWGLVLNGTAGAIKLHPSVDSDILVGGNFVTKASFPIVTTHPKTKAYVINLDSRKDRFLSFMRRVKHSLADDVVDIVRVSASVGKDVVEKMATDTEFQHIFRIDREKYPKSNPYDYHKSKPGEMGCGLSHYRVWKDVASTLNDDEFVIVFEDDVYFNSNFSHRFDVLREYLEKLLHSENTDGHRRWDVCFLGTTDDVKGENEYGDISVGCAGDRTSKIDEIYNSSTNVLRFNPAPSTPRINGGGTFAYLLTGKGARRYISYVNEYGIAQAVDWFMFEMMKFNVSLKCFPHLVSSPIFGQTTDSDIQDQPTPSPNTSEVVATPEPASSTPDEDAIPPLIHPEEEVPAERPVITSAEDIIRRRVEECEEYRKTREWDLAYQKIMEAVNLETDNQEDVFVYQRYHLLGAVGYFSKNYEDGLMGAQKAYKCKNLEVDKRYIKFYLNAIHK